MIQCKHCNAALPNKAKYCTECGTQVPDNIKFCPECHTDVPENARFCVECGAVIDSKNSKSISAILVILIIIGAGLVVYRSLDIKTDKNYYINQSTEGTHNQSAYDEVTFHTTIFKGQTRNEIRINVYTPTTQALIVEHVMEWINKSLELSKINDADDIRIDVYEKNDNTGEETLRAKFIRINLELNPNYSFPEGNYSNIGDHLYINWISKQAN